MKGLFKKMPQKWNQAKVLLKYCAVGTMGTLIDIGSLMVFVDYIGLPILIATTISFILAVINNFTLNKYWTFQCNQKNIGRQFLQFLMVSLIGLLLTLILMYIFVYIFTFWYVIAKLGTSLIVLTWNFLANKYWTFKKPINIAYFPSHQLYELSVIIPAFNEENRLGKTLEEIHQYFKKHTFTTEIIVVDDGSVDNTVKIAELFRDQFENYQVISYKHNQGKGHAIREGVKHAKGKYIMFTDADNSTPITEFEKIYPLVKQHKIIIGSRYLPASNMIVKQSSLRRMISKLGHKLIKWFLLDNFQDTQCGFKIFEHNIAKNIFSRMKIKRFGFDFEFLALAQAIGHQAIEVPIDWYDSPESKVRPIKDTLLTLIDLFRIKLHLWSGEYE